ncbi:MAG: clostripain-related cysteine peptidase [Spirochaetales bacterium]|nr:clostripain-related cysteine peptidase [Spirochaetales bacterium]
MKRFVKFASILILFILFISCDEVADLPDDEAVVDPDLPEWTAIVHFAIDNNIDYYFEEEAGIMSNYLGTLEEVEAADSENNIQIIVFMDGCQSEDSYTSEFDDGYYVLTGGEFTEDLTFSLDEVNSGSVSESKAMMDWVVENYPAQKYLYSVFNHGGGFDDYSADGTYTYGSDKGIGFDDSDDDSLSHSELGELVEYLSGLINSPVDLFYPYACLMGGIELAYEVKDSAEYILFSEDVFPAENWSYEALGEIPDNPSIGAEELATAFCNSAYDFFITDSIDRSFTLALVDLDKVDNLADKLDDLAVEAIADLNTDDSIAETYNDAAEEATSMYTSYYIDIYSYMNEIMARTEIADEVRTAAGLVNSALESAVLTFTQNYYDEAGGISIYNSPWYSTTYSETDYTQFLEFGEDTSWADFQSLVYSLEIPLEEDDYEPDDSYDAAGTITLNESQSHNLHNSEDVDWIKFTAEEGESYLISIPYTTNSILDMYLYYESDLNNYIDYGWEGYDIYIDSADSGTYYIKIESYNEGYGTYSLSLEDFSYSSQASYIER